MHLPESVTTYDSLINAYNENHRYYHNTTHIDDCLQQLDLVKNLIPRQEEAELALWFHDAIYKTRSSTNEEDSAAWVNEFLTDAAAPKEIAKRIHASIMATKHNSAPDFETAQWMVDIDLSILGREASVYDVFEKNIRKEYWWVPKPIYAKKRCDVLHSFLNRSHIYYTAHFQSQYEQSARENLQRAINRLRG